MSGKKEKLKRRQEREKQKQQEIETGATPYQKSQVVSMVSMFQRLGQLKKQQEALNNKK